MLTPSELTMDTIYIFGVARFQTRLTANASNKHMDFGPVIFIASVLKFRFLLLRLTHHQRPTLEYDLSDHGFVA